MKYNHIHQIIGASNMGMKSSKRRQKPSDPAEIARRRMAEMESKARAAEIEARNARDPAHWGIADDIGQLETGADIAPSRDVAGKITRARRWDVFSLLRGAGTLTGDHIIVVDRFHRLLAIRHQTAGGGEPGGVVSGTLPRDYPAARLEAGDRLDGLLSHMGEPHAELMLALSIPTITRGERVNWRRVVQAQTGEFRDAEHGKIVRRACDALEAAVAAGADKAGMDAGERKRAELVMERAA